MSEESFDDVVIGSGLGGLTAAALLAKAGHKVCVIERNHSVGGCASVFKKGTLTIEPALHQTADPRDPSEPKHEILKELGLLDEIEWVPVSPFFSVRGGPVGDTFDLPVGFDAAREAMARRFSACRTGIDRLFALMETVQAGVADLNRARADRSAGRLLRGVLELRSLVGDWRASLDDVLARTLGDHEAPKFAIAGNLGYYADDPRRMWWPFFALAQGAFLSVGGVFIKGGSRTLSVKLAKVVMKATGSVLLGREAVGIDVDASGRPAYCATSIQRRPKWSNASARKSYSPIARRMFWRACSAGRGAARLSAPIAGARFQRRCSRRILASARRQRSSVSIATERSCCRNGRSRCATSPNPRGCSAPIPAAACQAMGLPITALLTAAWPTAARRWSASSALID